MSSYTHPSRDNQEYDNTDVAFDILSTSSNNSLMSSSASSASSESSQQQLTNKRVVKSCLLSTVIFSINFISSILVINLAKW